jgi:hypothetical protein
MNGKCYISTTKINDNDYDRVDWDFLEAMLKGNLVLIMILSIC